MPCAFFLQGQQEPKVLRFDNLHEVCSLTASDRYRSIMSRVEAALAEAEEQDHQPKAWAGPSEEDPTYRLLVECNQLAVDIDSEIGLVHNFVRDQYRPRFPELESLVHHPIDYARVVKAIGNEEDLTCVELDDVLPSSTIMVVTVTASTTAGKPLAPEQLAKVIEGCDMGLQLDADKAKILTLVERKMNVIAPNLSVALGPAVAAKLMGIAGGLINLSKMPACNVQVLGAKRKNLAGFSSTTVQPHQGFISGAEIIQQTPPAWRNKAVRLVAGKCTLLARVDAYGQDPSGEVGRQFRTEMLAKIEKWQEPPPAKTVKPILMPAGEAKKRRGGRRLRKMKERYGMTEVRKAANRIGFNSVEEEVLEGDEFVGLGMLGRGETGKLRVAVSTQKQKLTKSAQKKLAGTFQSTRGVSGLSSSLAFTPVQGIELVNPQAVQQAQQAKRDTKDGTQSYFSDGGFRSIQRKI